LLALVGEPSATRTSRKFIGEKSANLAQNTTVGGVVLTAERREFKRSAWPSITFVIVSATIVVGCAIGVLTVLDGGWQWWSKSPDYTRFYEHMGLAALPRDAENKPKIKASLDKLAREPCFKDAALELSDELAETGYPRESANLMVNFGEKCGASSDYSVLEHVYLGYIDVSDYAAALKAAEQLVSNYPENASARLTRAHTYELLGRFEQALSDYISAVELSERSSLAAKHYYNIARMYAALGRYCDAIGPLQTYLAIDPLRNRTNQLTQIISGYVLKGNCASTYANGRAHVPFLRGTGHYILSVTVNGVKGTFLLDTGASYVAITRDFAEKARIKSGGDRLPMKTAGGRFLAAIGYAETVAIDKAAAQGIPLVVFDGQPEPFGSGLDGLLGMSFLSRFKVQMSGNALDLDALPLN
jgi:aspartyl protease family protein